jgi:hypothetical protein
MAVSLSALRTGRPFPPQEYSWYSFPVWDWVHLRAIVRLEGLGKFKKSISSGLEPATFRLVAQCPSHYATACYPYVYSSCSLMTINNKSLKRNMWNVLRRWNINMFTNSVWNILLYTSLIYKKVRRCDVTSDKFNTVEICTSLNCIILNRKIG